MTEKDKQMIIFCRKYIHDIWSTAESDTTKAQTKQCLDWLGELSKRLDE